ncbi:MAG: substrate-binding domain-containing protein [Granulosicoccus sp.]
MANDKPAKRPRSRKGAPGIVDVAQRAGVSPATVSRFYNSPKMLRGQTRQRISKAAVELGYIRNRMAGALHSRFSGTIGLVVPTINNAIFAELIEAFSSQLQKHDCNMLIASHNYDLDLEVSIVRSLLERRIDGVALVGHDHSTAALEMLKVRDVPVIALWNYRGKSSIPCIGADNAAAAATVTQHLIDLGHTDIALLFPNTESNDRARDRKQAALAVMQASKIVVAAHRVLLCPYSIEVAKDIATQLIRDDKPTAIVCGNDIIAHGVIYAAHACKLKLPDDLSIVGIGDFTGSGQIEPGLTTVRLPARRIGQLAADTIVKMSVSDSAEARTSEIKLAVDAPLVVRESTGRLPT